MTSDSSKTEPSLTHRVGHPDAGIRLDRLVARLGQVSRRIARQWIATGRVRVNGRVVRILTRPLRAGSDVRIAMAASEAPASSSPSADDRDVRIIHLDRWVVAVNKPSGLLSESDRFGGPAVETVLPGLLAERGERRTEVRLVHRLDAATSGVLILARTPAAATALGAVFREARAQKTYAAICSGKLESERDVDAPIGRIKGTRHGVIEGGKPAQTRFEPQATSEQVSWVWAYPRTGRTHQIRVHLRHLEQPILGDGLYSGRRYIASVAGETVAVPRLMLHAHRLSVPHPKTGEPLTLEAPLPGDFVACLQHLGLASEGFDSGA